jgi:hypothetical protein
MLRRAKLDSKALEKVFHLQGVVWFERQWDFHNYTLPR